jgi:hypothetical protein
MEAEMKRPSGGEDKENMKDLQTYCNLASPAFSLPKLCMKTK